MHVSKSALAIPILIIIVGAGWLLSANAIERDLHLAWSIGLACIGVSTLAIRGVDKASIVLGPFFLVAALLPVLRQEKLLTPDIELAGLVLASGVLTLLAQAPAFPWPGRVEVGLPLRTRLHAVTVGVGVAGLLVSGIGALTWLGAAMATSESVPGGARFFGNIAVLGGAVVAAVAGLGVAALAKRRPFGAVAAAVIKEPNTVRGRRLLVPLLSVGLGTAWLITDDLGANQILHVWTAALTVIGILALAVGGFDRIGVVLGPAYLLAAFVSWRQDNFDNAGVPIVITGIGMLLLLAQSPRPRARSALWNIISMATPFVGFLCGFAVGAANASELRGGAVALGFGVWLAFAVFGLLAAAIAFARGEKWWGLTLIAMLINLAVAIGLAMAAW